MSNRQNPVVQLVEHGGLDPVIGWTSSTVINDIVPSQMGTFTHKYDTLTELIQKNQDDMRPIHKQLNKLPEDLKSGILKFFDNTWRSYKSNGATALKKAMNNDEFQADMPVKNFHKLWLAAYQYFLEELNRGTIITDVYWTSRMLGQKQVHDNIVVYAGDYHIKQTAVLFQSLTEKKLVDFEMMWRMENNRSQLPANLMDVWNKQLGK